MDEQNIPIDIHTNKLLEWLISRRHVTKDWQNNITKIREKINNAIQDMPEHKEIVKLLSGQHINYFHCLKIVEILKETEADSKNLFGSYGSKRMKDWLDIISNYQRDNLYLAEASQLLSRNVSYEIPSLKKQIAKLEQSQIDCEKKIKEYLKNESTVLKEFHQACEQLGISGENIKNELIELVKDLPKLNDESAEKIKETKAAIELYKAFTKFLSGKEENVLPALGYLVKNGNTSVYEYLYGKKPAQIEVEKKLSIDHKEPKSEQIDLGKDIDFGDNEISDSIDFGEITPAEENIDWSMNTEEGFEIVEHSDAKNGNGVTIVKVPELKKDSEIAANGIAKGDEALNILDNPKTRDLVLNDLLELESYLKMRFFEMSNESDLLSMSQMQDAPSILQLQTIETIGVLSNTVASALNELNNKKIQHLHNIKHSANYVDILSSSLEHKLTVIERVKNNKAVLDKKITDCKQEMHVIEGVIELLVEKTKILQKEIQQDISKKYKGRIVNIIGGVALL